MVTVGRSAEGRLIADVVDGVRVGRSGVLVLRGPPGVGKSTLLEDAVQGLADFYVLRAGGVESEFELPYAGLHQLLRPVRDHVDRLPEHQARVLRVALGLEQSMERPSGDERFLVAVAVLGLLAEAAEPTPMLCLVDDAHWLDHASATILNFVARRLAAERIGILFAVRDGGVGARVTAGLPELRVGGLDRTAATTLLEQRMTGPVNDAVCEQLVRWTDGNPLALIELPSILTAGQLAGLEPLPVPLPATASVERIYATRIGQLSQDARTALLIAAADQTGRVAVVLAATRLLAAGPAGLDGAQAAGLLAVRSDEIVFSHPLVRSAVYQGASMEMRRRVHVALAEVVRNPDRRAWHLSAATAEPDEMVVRELEAVAERARIRGAFHAASAALERAADLTADAASRCRRLTWAAESAWTVGDFGRVSQLVQKARPLASDPSLRVSLGRLRGWLELSVGSPATAHRILLDAALDAGTADPRAARGLLAAAAESAWLTSDGEAGAELARVLANLPPADGRRDRVSSDLLAGFLGFLAGDVGTGVRQLKATIALAERVGDDDLVGLAAHDAFYVGDDDAALRLNSRVVARARADGAAAELLFALPRLVQAELLRGHWTAAAGGAAEAIRLAGECGREELAALPLAWLALLAAVRGDQRFWSLVEEADEVLATHALGVFGAPARELLQWSRAIQKASTGRPASAFGLLAELTHPVVTGMASLDRIEAAVHAGRADSARRWLAELEVTAAATGSAWSIARVAHCHGVLSEGTAAVAHFEEALIHHDDARRPFERARTELACGEMLRRMRRRVNARAHLEPALDTFDRLGASSWAERARAELRACGQTARRRNPSTLLQLTPQELQVARFVVKGLPTRDVAAQLFLSPRTVEFHLHNVFTKLSISSRTELAALHLD